MIDASPARPAHRSPARRRPGFIVAVAMMVGVLGAAGASAAPPLAGRTATVSLVDGQGRRQAIATLAVDAQGAYTLTFDDAPFEPKFLSMRPFQCLPAPPRLQCHLPYPYEKTARITADDLSSLSYDLLFLVKQASEFGIDFWNGRYYRLQAAGDRVTGTARAVDLNDLASRPPAGRAPIRASDIKDIAPGDTPYPTLVIE